MRTAFSTCLRRRLEGSRGGEGPWQRARRIQTGGWGVVARPSPLTQGERDVVHQNDPPCDRFLGEFRLRLSGGLRAGPRLRRPADCPVRRPAARRGLRRGADVRTRARGVSRIFPGGTPTAAAPRSQGRGGTPPDGRRSHPRHPAGGRGDAQGGEAGEPCRPRDQPACVPARREKAVFRPGGSQMPPAPGHGTGLAWEEITGTERRRPYPGRIAWHCKWNRRFPANQRAWRGRPGGTKD